MFGKKPPTKGGVLATQPKNTITMAKILEIGSVNCNDLCEGRTIAAKSNNLEVAMGLKVLAEDDMKARGVLGL